MSIVTISRGAKSGGVALAEALSARLGYTCLSREILVEGARRYNIDEETLQREISHVPSLWERLTKERHRYLVFIRCALLQAARKDRVVYHGHAGQLFLQGIPHVLKVRIEAPLEQRVRAVLNELKIDREAAIAHIQQVDEQRRRWVSFLFDKDWRDPSLYDLTINLASMSIDTACSVVCRALESPEFSTTDAAQRTLDNQSLACEVRAALAADDRLWNQPLEVSAKDNLVAIRGTVQTKEQRDAITHLVTMVKGVTDAQVQLTLSSDPLPPVAHWGD